MPRTNEANERIRTEQQARIIEAARRVFARKGFAATIDDVAVEAGISHGLAYRYFANKTALFSELVLQDLEGPTEWFEAFAEASGPAIEKIRRMIGGLMASRREHPERYQLLNQVLNDESSPADLREWVAERGRVMRDVLRNLIADGQTAGEVASGEPDQLVRAIFAELEGLSLRPSGNLEAFQADYPNVEIILRMLKP